MDTKAPFPAGHPVFDGHFPDRPIVPAVALLAEVLAAVEAATRKPPTAWTVAQAKFVAAVAPDTPLAISHEEGPGGTRTFEVHARATLVAHGTLAPAAP